LTNKKSSYLGYGRMSNEGTELTSQGHNPDMFNFNLEVRMLKCLFFLVSAISDSIHLVDFISGGATGVGANLVQVGATLGGLKYLYDDNFWKRIPSSVNQVQLYLLNTVLRMVSNEEAYKKALVRLTMFDNASENAAQNKFTPTIFPPISKTEMQRMAFAAMEMIYFVHISIIQGFDTIDKFRKVMAADLMKRAKIEANNYLLGFERINRQKMIINPTASVMNKSSIAGMSARKNDDEDLDDRFFVNFIKKYFSVPN
jgi:hypothetical protein